MTSCFENPDQNKCQKPFGAFNYRTLDNTFLSKPKRNATNEITNQKPKTLVIKNKGKNVLLTKPGITNKPKYDIDTLKPTTSTRLSKVDKAHNQILKTKYGKLLEEMTKETSLGQRIIGKNTITKDDERMAQMARASELSYAYAFKKESPQRFQNAMLDLPSYDLDKELSDRNAIVLKHKLRDEVIIAQRGSDVSGLKDADVLISDHNVSR